MNTDRSREFPAILQIFFARVCLYLRLSVSWAHCLKRARSLPQQADPHDRDFGARRQHDICRARSASMTETPARPSCSTNSRRRRHHRHGNHGQAPPDGYTILMSNTSHSVLPSLHAKLHDPIKDFAPVSLVASRTASARQSALPVKNVKELIDLAAHSRAS
jgi:hypothetical protein